MTVAARQSIARLLGDSMFLRRSNFQSKLKAVRHLTRGSWPVSPANQRLAKVKPPPAMSVVRNVSGKIICSARKRGNRDDRRPSDTALILLSVGLWLLRSRGSPKNEPTLNPLTRCCPYCSSTSLVKISDQTVDGTDCWQCASCSRVLGPDRSQILTVFYLIICVVAFLVSCALPFLAGYWQMAFPANKPIDIKGLLGLAGMPLLGALLGLFLSYQICRELIRKTLGAGESRPLKIAEPNEAAAPARESRGFVD